MKDIFQILTLLCSYASAYSKQKTNILIFAVLSSIFSALMFWAVRDFAAILPSLATGIRYFVFMFKDKYKNKVPLYICLVMHFIVLIISVNTLIDVIPSVLTIIGCLIYWYLDKAKLKASTIMLNLIWMIYYIFFGLYLVAINVLIQNIIMAIALLKIHKENIQSRRDG